MRKMTQLKRKIRGLAMIFLAGVLLMGCCAAQSEEYMETEAKSQQAMDTANAAMEKAQSAQTMAADSADRADAAADRAEAAADRAEDAADRAEAMADKSERTFMKEMEK